MSNEESSAAAVTEPKKSSSWDWLLPSIAAVVIVKLFGVLGGLIAVGVYYLLMPKLETCGAVTVAGVTGVIAASVLGAVLRA